MVRLEPLAESYDRASGPEHRTPRPNGPCPSHEHPSNKLVSPATQLELAKHMTQEELAEARREAAAYFDLLEGLLIATRSRSSPSEPSAA